MVKNTNLFNVTFPFNKCVEDNDNVKTKYSDLEIIFKEDGSVVIINTAKNTIESQCDFLN